MPREVEVPAPAAWADIGPALGDALSAVDPGGTVVLPAGRFHLEGELRVVLRKPLTLRGRGRDRTCLFKRGRSADARCMIAVHGRGDPADALVVRDLALEGAPAGELDEAGRHGDIGLRLAGCPGFTVRRCRFTSFGHAAVQVRHPPATGDGLVAGCEFADNHHPDPRPGRGRPSSLGYGVEVRAAEGGPWLADPAAGEAGFVFVEDCHFAGHRHAVAGGEGGLYVFRHNRVERHLSAHAADSHGAGEHGNALSTRCYEVYRNHLVAAPAGEAAAGGFAPATFALGFRGGEGVAFENTAVGFPRGVRLAVEVPAPGYPVPYQIGWASGVAHGAGHRGTDGGLAAGDLFLWDNRFTDLDGRPVRVGVHVGPADHHLLVEGRDFHRVRRPGYAPYRYPHPRAEVPGADPGEG